jgi:hypothetical protein
MKIIVFFCLLTLYSCTSYSDQQVIGIKDRLLANILALSEVTDLNKLQADIEKNLWIKIYQVPGSQDNDCFPESHGVCKYKYYLATSQLDDSPVVNSYYLGELGEITGYTWVATDEIDTAIIKFTANGYTKEAIRYNSKLNNVETRYKLIAKPDTVRLMKSEN